MLFNSLDFALFLPIVFILYWHVFRSLKQQNILIALASYLFYGWWDWRFLFLVLFSTVVDYTIGLRMSHTDNKTTRRYLLWISLVVNLGLLGFFKYYNFFLDSFTHSFTFFGQQIGADRLNIILPVGISFYTFQTLSYTIDVYKGKLKPTAHFITFASFVSFFPQLVAGPIERATNLLPQFESSRHFDLEKAKDGLRQMLWGFFKKMVIADNCATYVDQVFGNYTAEGGSTLFLAAVLFAFQIYCDFSGYSDIAIGTARLFGFDLMRNFAYPYFSRDIAEFWRRWHISLSTWFRDYLYIPLGGSRGGKWLNIRNVFIVFLVSGFWHGANWTFIVWGGLHALYFLPLMLLNKNRQNLDTVALNKAFPDFKELFQMGITFFLVTIAWIFFRANTITDALVYIRKLFSSSLVSVPSVPDYFLIIFLALFLIAEWFNREHPHAFYSLKNKPKALRWFAYHVVVLILIFFSYKGEQKFLYFDF